MCHSNALTNCVKQSDTNRNSSVTHVVKRTRHQFRHAEMNRNTHFAYLQPGKRSQFATLGGYRTRQISVIEAPVASDINKLHVLVKYKRSRVVWHKVTQIALQK
jgi:hypothetical protein